MLNEKTIELLEKLSSAVGKSSEYIIEKYSIWYFSAGVYWVLFGLFLVLFGVFKFRFPFDEDDEVEKITNYCLKGLLVFIGCIFIGVNIGDIMSPDGIAIHNLISDLKK